MKFFYAIFIAALISRIIDLAKSALQLLEDKQRAHLKNVILL